MPAVPRRLDTAGHVFHHVGPPELEADERIENRDEAHRQHEKQKRRELERVADDDPLDRAHNQVGIVSVVQHAELQRLR